MEALGTFLFVFMGSMLSINPLLNGLLLSISILLSLPFAPGHLNPAVTMASVISNRVSWTMGIRYLFEQWVGAVVGGWLVWYLSPESIVAEPTTLAYTRLCIYEFLATIVFLQSVFIPLSSEESRPWLIGMTLGCVSWALNGQVTCNPLRSLFPIIFVYEKMDSFLLVLHVMAQLAACVIVGVVVYFLDHVGTEERADEVEML